LAPLNLPRDAISVGSLGSLLEGLIDGVIVVDPERRVRAFNSSFARLFSLEPGVVRSGDTLETLWRALAARGGLEIGLSTEAAIRRRLALWGTEADRRERRYLANGRVLDILRSHTEDGDIVAVHVDVTESLKRERELELQRIYMASILENITDGVSLVDATGHYIAFNRRFLDLFDVDPDRVHWGMHVDALYEEFGDLKDMPPADRAAAIAERKAFITDAGRTAVERHLGNGRVLDITKALLPSGGCVLTVRDKTEALARERELARARRAAEEVSLHKSQFLARMSHEMRTPLNGVLGIAAVLRTTDLDPRQRELVEVIASSGDMLLRLIDDVLDLSRIEAGSIELCRAPFRLGTVMRDCVALMRPGAEAKGLALIAAPCPDPDPTLIGDGVRLKQVLINLLANGIKFTPRGEVRISRTIRPEGAGCACRIRVSDTGIGIPEDRREAVFEQFYQIDATPTRMTGGAGLGLTISRRLVEAMGGTIVHAPRPGGGTVFEIDLTLPRAGPGGAPPRP